MKITRLEVIKVKPRWMFLKMYTDTDIVGLGEPVLEGHCNSVEAVIKEFEEYLIGKDPMQIEHHLQAMYRGGFYRGGSDYSRGQFVFYGCRSLTTPRPNATESSSAANSRPAPRR